MSKKAALFLLVVVGVIVLWGALTGWTFSGRLPREGAKCTPDEGSKDENSEEYIYNADKECLIVNTCKEGWKPNSSNTACISTLSGDTCTGTDRNAVYKYDTGGECVFDSCVTGFEKSGTECISTLSGDTCTGANENGIYKYDNNGECVLEGCDAGYILLNNECVELTISDKQTARNEYSGNLFLDRHDVRCDSGALNKFVLKPGGTHNGLYQVYYDYKCIENIPGFSLGDEQETSQVIRTSISTHYLTDPNIGVDCGDSPISRFQLGNVRTDSGKQALLYNYNCANNSVKTSTCTDKESTGTSNIEDARAILENEVACDGKGVITRFQLAKKDDADGGKYYYKYRCCDL